MNGYAFAGWTPRPERMPAEDVTITAQWDVAKPSEYVEIVFDRKGLSKEKVKEIVEKYVQRGEEFAIETIESGSDGTRVVIKFTDQEKASEFIRSVNESRRPEDNIIKVIRPSSEYKSLAFPNQPFFSIILL